MFPCFFVVNKWFLFIFFLQVSHCSHHVSFNHYSTNHKAADQGCHSQGKKSVPGQGKVRELWFESGKLEKKTDKSQGKIREFQNFLKTEMTVVVSLIFRDINLQSLPLPFVK